MSLLLKAVVASILIGGKTFLSTKLYRYFLVIPLVFMFGIMDFSRRLPKEIVDKKGKKEKLPLDPFTLFILGLPDSSLKAPYESLGPNARMTTLWYHIMAVVIIQFISTTSMSIVFIAQELFSRRAFDVNATILEKVLFCLISFTTSILILFGERYLKMSADSELSLMALLSISILSGPVAILSNFIVKFFFVKEKLIMMRPIIAVLLVTLLSFQSS